MFEASEDEEELTRDIDVWERAFGIIEKELDQSLGAFAQMELVRKKPKSGDAKGGGKKELIHVPADQFREIKEPFLTLLKALL